MRAKLLRKLKELHAAKTSEYCSELKMGLLDGDIHRTTNAQTALYDCDVRFARIESAIFKHFADD